MPSAELAVQEVKVYQTEPYYGDRICVRCGGYGETECYWSDGAYPRTLCYVYTCYDCGLRWEVLSAQRI